MFLPLAACNVEYAIIADRDYAADIGDQKITSFFSVDTKSIRKDVLDNPASLDGRSLVSRMEEALATAKLEDLRQLWEYVKARRRRLRQDLSDGEKATLNLFIQRQRERGVFVLSRGDLETYLPEGYRDKDLNKLIRFLERPDFWEQLGERLREELTEIVMLAAPSTARRAPPRTTNAVATRFQKVARELIAVNSIARYNSLRG